MTRLAKRIKLLETYNDQALKHQATALAQKLVDWVSTATQLDPEKNELPNIDDWQRNAKKLFEQVLREERLRR